MEQRLDALNEWIVTWWFWLPYMLGFSTGGLCAVAFLQRSLNRTIAEYVKPDQKETTDGS